MHRRLPPALLAAAAALSAAAAAATSSSSSSIAAQIVALDVKIAAAEARGHSDANLAYLATIQRLVLKKCLGDDHQCLFAQRQNL